MQTSLTNFREQYHELLMNFLWRQWDALGVAGVVEGEDIWPIDPEALLVFTCTMGRYEARLFDEVIDWLHKNGTFLNTQRLKKIIKQENFSGQQTLAAIAGLLNHGTDALKWKSLASCQPGGKELESLFYFGTGEPMGSWGKSDPHFEKYGFFRGPLNLRGYSQRFRPNTTTNLILQLRSLFGANARCEILAYLITHKEAHPSEVARETYYYKKTVQDTMVDMASSGIIHTRTVGREKRYWLNLEQWAKLLHREDSIPQWITWAPLFSALERIWLESGKIAEKENKGDKLVLASQLNQLMKEVRPDIQRAGFHEALSGERQYQGEEIYDAFIFDIKRLLSRMQSQ